MFISSYSPCTNHICLILVHSTRFQPPIFQFANEFWGSYYYILRDESHSANPSETSCKYSNEIAASESPRRNQIGLLSSAADLSSVCFCVRGQGQNVSICQVLFAEQTILTACITPSHIVLPHDRHVQCSWHCVHQTTDHKRLTSRSEAVILRC